MTLLTAGLDVGSLYTKAVVARDGALAGWAVIPTGESSRDAAEQSLADALTHAGARREELRATAATGAGKREVGFATRETTEVMSVARGIRCLHPDATGVIDLGGESTHVVKLDEAGQVLEFSRNDKCAAGTGIFLDAMADLMKVPVPEMGPLSLTAQGEVEVSATCVVFAESEVVSAVHRQTPRENILRGIHKSIATRVHGLVNRVGLNGCTLAVGGLALNTGILACLQELMGAPVTVPEEPRIVTALGAALLAADNGGAKC